MAGALVHIGVGAICALIVHLIHFRTEFSLSIFLGNLMPDAIAFGVSGLVQGTLIVTRIKRDGFFHYLSKITNNSNNWIVAGIFAILLAFFLYHFHIIKKKTIKEYEELYIFLIIGIIIHLIMDVFIMEYGPWY